MYPSFSRLFQVVARPDSISLSLLCLACVLLWTRWWMRGRWLVTAIASCFLFISVLPVTEWLAHWLESGYPRVHTLPLRVDGIVALNGFDSDRAESLSELAFDGEEAMCFFEFVRLAHRYPGARRIYASGGLSPGGVRLLRQYFDEWTDLEGVQIEDQSKRTADRIPMMKRLARPEPGETWLLVTPALRTERNLEGFREVRWTVVPVPVGHHTLLLDFNDFRLADSLNDLWRISKEWVGIAVYKLFPISEAVEPSSTRL